MLTCRHPIIALLVVCFALTGPQPAARQAEQEQAEQQQAEQKRATVEAIVLWVGLVILAIAIIGIGLILGVSRGARRVLRMREPTRVEMPDIWFLNPPAKRKPAADKPDEDEPDKSDEAD